MCSLIVQFRGLALALLGLVCGAAFPVKAGSDDGVLVLGRISDDPHEHYAQLKPLLDYVVPRMANVGIREGQILMAKDAQQMASYLRRGKVDWVTETAASAVLLQDRANAQPILLTERDGTSYYRSIFFARRDSGIQSLDDLRGHSVAFQRFSSTSAYYVPAAELLGLGLRLELLLSPTDGVASDEVGYLFARSELNISTWVHKRLVDAGAMSNLDWENPRRMPPTFARDFVIIGKSEPYPRALELVRGNLDERVRDRLAQVLVDAASDPDASEALLKFFRTTRFLPLDEAARASLSRLATRIDRVHREVE